MTHKLGTSRFEMVRAQNSIHLLELELSRLMVDGVNIDLMDCLLVRTGARGSNWNLEQVWVEMLRMLWLSLGTLL